MGSSFMVSGSGFTKMKQHKVISNTAITNGGAIIAINSKVGMLNLVYKYRFCGFPKGVSIPPKLAAIFCIIKVNAIYLLFPVEVKTNRPNGRKVSSAISLAMSIEPIKVI